MRVYFETSGINSLANDTARDSVLRVLRWHHDSVISSLSLAEILSTSSSERRAYLFHLAAKLATTPAQPGRRILLDVPDLMVWALHPLISKEIAPSPFKTGNMFWELPFLLNPDEVRDNQYNLWMDALTSGIRDRTIKQASEDRTKASAWVNGASYTDRQILLGGRRNYLRYLLNERHLLCDFVRSQLDSEKYSNVREKLNGKEMDILQQIDVWRFNIAARLIEMHDRLIQPSGYSNKRNPGWVDIQQAAYLGCCDFFVTDDRKQRDFLRIVSIFGVKSRKVISYSQLKRELGC